MATIQKENEGNDENTFGVQSPSTPSGGSGQQPQYVPPTQGKPQGGGRFTNIQKYLAANQSGGQKIQQGIESKQDQQAEQIRKGVEASQTKFNQQAQPEQQRLQQAQPFVQQTLQQNQLTPEQIKQYQDLAQQKGAFNNITGLQNAPSADPLQQAAKAAGSEQGRFDLLKKSFAVPSYSSGQQRLDQLLLGGQNPQGLQRNLQQKATEANNLVSTAQTQATDQVNQLKTQAQQAAEAANTGLSTAQNQLQTDLESRAKAATDKQSQEQKILMDLFGGKTGQGMQNEQQALDLIQRLGYKPEDTVYLPKDVSPQTFIGATQQAQLGDVANADEKLRYQALQQLAGQQGNLQSGGFDPNAYFNRDAFSSQQKEIADRAASSIAPQKDEVSRIQNQLADIENSYNSGNTEYWAPGAAYGRNRKGMELDIANLKKQLEGAQTNLTSAQQPFGGTTYKDLIAKYANMPMKSY